MVWNLRQRPKNCFSNIHYTVWNTYIYLIICIIGNLRYVRNLVITWQSAEVPTFANRIPEIKEKVKIAPETCCKNRKRYDKSYKNFWNAYEYIITVIRLMSVLLTKQASGFKYLTLQTTNCCSFNLYTLVKIGANSCQMVEKHLYKSYCKFRNGHSYLEWRILGIKKYLHTIM